MLACNQSLGRDDVPGYVENGYIQQLRLLQILDTPFHIAHIINKSSNNASKRMCMENGLANLVIALAFRIRVSFAPVMPLIMVSRVLPA